MIDIRDHVYTRIRQRFPKYKEYTDLQIKEVLVVAAIDSCDYRILKRKRNIIAIIFENIVMITEADGRNIKIVTVYKYGEKSNSWIYKENLIRREEEYEEIY